MEQVALEDFSANSLQLAPEVAFEAPRCLIHTNFGEVDAEEGRRHLEALYVARQRRVPAIRLMRLPRLTTLAVPSGQDFFPVLDNVVLRDQVRRDWTDEDLTAALRSCVQNACIPEQAVVIARYGLQTWGHWLGELLPKLVCVETAFPGQFKYVFPRRLANDEGLRQVRGASLLAYEIGEERLILVRPGHSYEARKLDAVSSVWSADNSIHPHAVEVMRTIQPPDAELRGLPDKVALLRRRVEDTKHTEHRRNHFYAQRSRLGNGRRWQVTIPGSSEDIREGAAHRVDSRIRPHGPHVLFPSTSRC